MPEVGVEVVSIKIKKRGQESIKAGINIKARARRERLRDAVGLFL